MLRLLLSALMMVTSTSAWTVESTSAAKREIHNRSSESSVDLSTRGGGEEKAEVQVPPSFHWAQVYAIAFNVVGLYFPIKAGVPIVLRLMTEGALTTKQRYIGLSILMFVNLPSASKFAFSIAPKMVNRTIDRVCPQSTWHRKLLAPLATIGLIPFTHQVLKRTVIITSFVCLYFYITGLIPQPYQDIYKSGVYYLNLAPMTIGMIVGMLQHYFKFQRESNIKSNA